MRYSKEHKHETKRRILQSAYRLFTAKGFDGTSIEAIMSACDLTRGGFYAHFKSKSQLYREAMKLAAARKLAPPPAFNESAWLDAMFKGYLDAESARNDASRNRWTFLVTDVASNNPEVRAAYADAFKAMSEKITGRMAGQFGCSEELILSVMAMTIGAAAIARAVDDADLKAKLLTACRKVATALIENKSALAPLSFFWEKESPTKLRAQFE
ncbi:MAG TPA: TetR family transcriptional regulator [Steroidobacteraceae bacterium]|nr:TetR family transcriptional regulator [Steroidobacteraceae bacterium]